ncbi:MAG: phosphoribosylanthranilate isomerase [Candidatus Bathyarchaeota archaeon]|nr:phosphoribosylanthranilate isomerase [Candidatus Bathyarchaeota archaeon]
MSAIRVKICGITRKEDLDAAVKAGTDAVGFVVGVASSPRNLSMGKAAKLFRQVPPFVKSVLVTVPTSIEELVETCRKLNPDAVQIHRNDPNDAALLRETLPNTALIGAVNANSPDALETAATTSKIFDAVLIDSLADGQYGGTGTVHDWKMSQLIKRVIHPTPLILAGGLNPANVAEAIRVVQPYAVDVSSGVEHQPGIKDNQKIIEFVKNAKNVKT